MLESVDPNAITPSTEALLPDAGAKGNKPPLPPLRLPSLPDEALPPVALAPIPLAAPAGAQPRSSGDQQHGTTATELARASQSGTVAAVDATTTTRRLAGLSDLLGRDSTGAEPATVLPGAGVFSPQSERAGRGSAAALIAHAEQRGAALCHHSDRVRALQLARSAVVAVHALQPLRDAISNGDIGEAVGALEAAAAADRARWFSINNIAAAYERLSSKPVADWGASSLQHTRSTARSQCVSLLQDAAELLNSRLKQELRHRADAHPTAAAQTQDLIDLANRFNAVLMPMVAADSTRRLLFIDADADLAHAATACLTSAQIVASAMSSTGAIGLGAQQLGGYGSHAAAAALRCDAEAIFSDHLYAISAELAPPRPPIGPSGIPPSGAAPLPETFGTPVPWHLSKVGSGVVGILQGLRVRCTTVEAAAPNTELAGTTVAQIAEIAGVAVCLFQSWAAQVFQRERCSLLELCTLHSDSLAVSNALKCLRARPLLAKSHRGFSEITTDAVSANGANVATLQDDGRDKDALDVAIARLLALQQAIGNHLSDGLEESAASFWELLPDKYWSPASIKEGNRSRSSFDDEAGVAAQHAGDGIGEQVNAPAGQYMRRLVEELIAPGTKSLLKLDPVTAQELLPRIVTGSLESLAAHLLKERPRFNEAGARRLRMDVGYLETWVRRKLNAVGGNENEANQDEIASSPGSATGLAATLLALPTFQRLRGAAALLADPDDRTARGELSAADAQAWLALRKWRPRMACGSAIC